MIENNPIPMFFTRFDIISMSFQDLVRQKNASKVIKLKTVCNNFSKWRNLFSTFSLKPRQSVCKKTLNRTFSTQNNDYTFMSLQENTSRTAKSF